MVDVPRLPIKTVPVDVKAFAIYTLPVVNELPIKTCPPVCVENKDIESFIKPPNI
jgi:hypothetical protein